MKKIYLDNAATTQVDKQVLKIMLPYFLDIFGNASSLHTFGQQASKAVEYARSIIAKFLNCTNDEVVFTSGATEADNLAILGTVSKGDHIITTIIEHPAVLETCKKLERENIEVTYVKPQSNGIILVEDIKKEIKNNTRLISVMYVNNEIGTIQLIEKIGKMLTEINLNRGNKILFHTDAVQAVNYLEMDVKKLGVDLLSLSGHKIYGPKGIGALFVKKGTKLNPIQFGGHQEKGIRPGTTNTPAIVGLGQAINLIEEKNSFKIKELRNYCWEKIQQNISNIKLNGDFDQRVPNNLNVSFAGVEGEALLLDLDLNGIAISTGSACSSGSLEPSNVLMAIGLSHEQAHGSLRISLGKNNTKKEIDYFISKLKQSVDKYRKMAPEL